MLTEDRFIDLINSIGADASSFDVSALLLDSSSEYKARHDEDWVIDVTTRTYKLPDNNVLSDHTQFFITTETALSCPGDTVYTPETLTTFEVFDHRSPAFVQTEPVALDPAFGICRLLAPLEDGQVLLMNSLRVTEGDIIEKVALGFDMCNPITSYKKGPVEVKVRPLSEILAMQHKLNSQSGKSVKIINATRYSNGRVKGRRDGV